jgi:glutathione S-transferase
VVDRLRPADKRDPLGVEEAKTRMHTALRMVDDDMRNKTWATGDDFTLADCAAAPALYYANLVVPLGEYANATAYLDRLKQRPSFARAAKEADPYRHLFPK